MSLLKIEDVSRLREEKSGICFLISGWVRSRRRGSQKLVFVDVNLNSLIDRDEEQNKHCEGTPVNDQHDMYYKYKTAFSPSEDTITLVIYSEDTQVCVEESNQTLTCDQFRKILTVGSKIECTAYKDNKKLHDKPEDLPWFRAQGERTNTGLLMRVVTIHKVESSRPVPHSNCTLSKQQTESKQMPLDREKNDEIHCNGKAHKKERTRIFVEWLEETYGRDYLNSGSGVIDVAGGKGAISWQLQCVKGITSTLIDPRSVHLSGRQKKYLRKMNRSKFKQFQVALQDPEYDSSIIESLGMNELLSECSLIIGMHPDEATDAIIDYAVYYSKPFALVPCCVYAELFPHRKFNGEPVTTYENLLNYLHAKVSDAQSKGLPFQGRHVTNSQKIQYLFSGMSYTNLDGDSFPSASFSVQNLKSLVYLSSWETVWVVKVFYYAGLAFLLLTSLLHVIFLTIIRSVGGFFLGFFSGIFTIVAGFLLLRLVCEMFLAIYVIRQNHSGSGESSKKNNEADFNFGKPSAESPFDKGSSFTVDSYQQV